MTNQELIAKFNQQIAEQPVVIRGKFVQAPNPTRHDYTQGMFESISPYIGEIFSREYAVRTFLNQS